MATRCGYLKRDGEEKTGIREKLVWQRELKKAAEIAAAAEAPNGANLRAIRVAHERVTMR